MSSSVNVIGLRDPKDAHHQAMLRVFEACKQASVQLPPEVARYFDPKGFAGAIPENINPEECLVVELGTSASEWKAEMQEGFQVDVTKLPMGVKVLRFYVSY